MQRLFFNSNMRGDRLTVMPFNIIIQSLDKYVKCFLFSLIMEKSKCCFFRKFSNTYCNLILYVI